jgi:hypothetical protein
MKDLNYDFGSLMLEAFRKEQFETSRDRILDEDGNIVIGASVACARQHAYDITVGRTEPTLSQYFRMKKGNVAEGVVERNLEAIGLEYTRQAEHRCDGIFDFIRSHPDIVIDLDQEPENKIAKEWISELTESGYTHVIVELKTTAYIPTEPHGYWVRQTSVQRDAMATTLNIDPDKIFVILYAIELNNGETRQYPMPPDEAELLLAKDDALSLHEFLEDWLQFAQKEKEHMEFSVSDVNRNVGNLCVICDHAAKCLGKGKEAIIPETYIPEILDVLEYSESAKPISAKKEELKKFMLNLGAKRAKVGDYSVVLSGGNEKTDIDEKSYKPEDIENIFKNHPDLITIDKKRVAALIGTLSKDEEWITNGHTVTKKTPVSIRVQRKK